MTLINPPPIPPGDVILEYLDDAAITREQFVDVFDVSTGAGVLDGSVIITRDIASKLEALLGRRAHFWLRLQRRWLGVQEWLWYQAPAQYRDVHPVHPDEGTSHSWSGVAFVPNKVFPTGEPRLLEEPECVRELWKWGSTVSRVHVQGGVSVAWTVRAEGSKLPCDPDGACASGGRCWTHSTWDDTLPGEP